MASDYPPLSVVIPMYNGARFIEPALDSVIDQPVPVTEIIVIDDGSSDDGADLAARHRSRPTVYRQENRGPAATRNRGVQTAQTPFVTFIDQDDLWSEDKLVKQFAAFEEEPDLMTCFGRIDFFWEDPDCEEARTFDGHHRTNAVEGYVTTTMLARKEAFEKVGMFDENLTFADSIDWCTRLKDMGVPSRMLDDVVLYHRMHDTNLTRRRKESTAEILQLLRKRRMAAGTTGG